MPDKPTGPSFGEILFEKLAKVRAAYNGTLTKNVWLATANAEFSLALKSMKPEKKISQSQMTDEQWVEWLEAQPCYEGIDVKREIGKCQAWASTAKKKPSRRRIINWLNKVERPVGFSGTGKSSAKSAPADPYKEPAFDWVSVAVQIWPGWVESPYYGKKWSEIPQDYRRQIVNKGKPPEQGSF